jgi:hypothetical protein
VLILVALLALNIMVLAALLMTGRRAEPTAADPRLVPIRRPGAGAARATPSPTPADGSRVGTPVDAAGEAAA